MDFSTTHTKTDGNCYRIKFAAIRIMDSNYFKEMWKDEKVKRRRA